MRLSKIYDQSLMVLALSGGLSVLLFHFRSLDDNATARWEWVFSVVKAADLTPFLIAGALLAYIASKRSPAQQLTAAFLFLVSFIIGVFFWSTPEFNIDASRYFTQAKHLELYGIPYFFQEWGKEVAAWSDLPAVPFLYGVTFKLVGESRLAVQFVVTLLFSFTVVLTYMTGKLLWDEDMAYYAAVLLLAIPYLFIQIPLMLVDVPTMFFLLLSLFAFIKALQCGGIWVSVIAPAALVAAFFSKYSAWPMLTVLIVVLVIFATNGSLPRKKMVQRGVVSVLIAMAGIGTVLVLKRDVVMEQIRLLVAFQSQGLKRWGESFVSTFLFQVHPFITIAALYSGFLAWKKRDPTYAIISWLPAIALLFQVRRVRYLLPIFPLLTLMAAYGLQAIKDKRTARCIVYCAVFSSIVLSLFAYVPYLKKQGAQNLMDAGRFLNTIPAATASVFVLPQRGEDINPAVAVPLLDLATRKAIIYEYAPQPAEPDAALSRYRFSWEYKNPAYYSPSGAHAGKNAVVVISRKPTEALPLSVQERIRGLTQYAVFDRHVDLFSFQTAVRVYW